MMHVGLGSKYSAQLHAKSGEQRPLCTLNPHHLAFCMPGSRLMSRCSEYAHAHAPQAAHAPLLGTSAPPSPRPFNRPHPPVVSPQALAVANLSVSGIDELLQLVGGPTIMPRLRQQLAEIFTNNTQLHTAYLPEEAVACGAAAQVGSSSLWQRKLCVDACQSALSFQWHFHSGSLADTLVALPAVRLSVTSAGGLQCKPGLSLSADTRRHHPALCRAPYCQASSRT